MKPFFSAVILVFLSTAVWHHGDCSTVQQRSEVLEHVMRSRGNVHVRPDGEEGDGSPLLVNVSFSLIRIVDLSVRYSRLEVIGYFFMSWTDPRLTFSHDNITRVRVPTTDIWTPDIELYDSDSKMMALNEQPLAVVYSSGQVFLINRVATNMMCGTNTTVPRFTAACHLKMGSWTYNGFEVDLGVPDYLDMSEYVGDRRWHIHSSSAKQCIIYSEVKT